MKGCFNMTNNLPYEKHTITPAYFDEVKHIFLDTNKKPGTIIPKPFATKLFTIKKVIFNPPCTIVLWSDNTKTIVKATDELFDPEKGVAMACMKKMLTGKEYHKRLKEANEQLDIIKKLNGILAATKALKKFSKTIEAFKSI